MGRGVNRGGAGAAPAPRPAVTGALLSPAAPQGVQGVEEQRRAPARDLQPAREAAAAGPRRGHGDKVVQHLRGQW